MANAVKKTPIRKPAKPRAAASKKEEKRFPTPPERHNSRTPINLALQGGGAHGAYTWGVLDALLEADALDIEGVSGTSAGGVNAVLLADGLARDGAEGARKLLREFWTRLGGIGAFYRVPDMGMEQFFGAQQMAATKRFMQMDWLSNYLSPYQLNPFNINPLRTLLADMVDFERVQRQNHTRVYINATNVRTGKIKVFETRDITLDAVMASSCLPLIFKAVEIDGEAYWDGGYSGNPAIFPLIYGCHVPDILLVQINPVRIEEVPSNATEIADRISDVSFNATLMGELRAIAFASKLVKQGKVARSEYKDVRMHRIASDSQMCEYDASTKLVADSRMIEQLFQHGRAAATQWLAKEYNEVGKTATLNIQEYL
jgi:NTE family protein